MIRLKKNEPFRYNGVYYDFTMLDEDNLKRIYDNNPSLRHLFETDKEEIVIPTTTEFEEELAKFGILTSNVTNKRLAELNKRRAEERKKSDEDDKIEEE